MKNFRPLAQVLLSIVVMLAAPAALATYKDGSRSGLRNGGAGRVSPAAVGAALYDDGAYGRAVHMLEISYKDNPTSDRQLSLSQALFAAGKYRNAASVAAREHEDRAAFERSLSLVEGAALVKLHRYEEAGRIAQTLLAQEPMDIDALMLASDSASALGRHDDAVAFIRDALRRGGAQEGEVWMRRAHLALYANDLVVARSAARRAEETGVDKGRVEAVLIEAMIRNGLLKEAGHALDSRAKRQAGLLDIADKVKPKADRKRKNQSARVDVLGLYLTAVLNLSSGAHKDAQRAFNALEPWLRHEVRGELRMAAVNWLAGDVARAKSQIDRTLNRAPEDFAALDLIVGMTLAAKDFKAASVQARRLLEATEKAGDGSIGGRFHSRAVQRLAASYAGAGAYDAAAELLIGAHTAPADDFRRFSGDPLKATSGALTHLFGAEAAIFAVDVSGPGDQAAPLKPLIAFLDGRSALSANRDATEFFDAALSAAPTFAHALEGAVLSELKAGEIEAARARLVQRLADDGDDATAWSLWARLAASVGEREAVLTAADAAPVFNSHALAAEAALRSANAAAARRHLSTLVGEQGPSLFAAHAYERLGEPARALRLYRAVLFNNPADQRAIIAYARVMRAQNRARQGAALLRRLAARHEAVREALIEAAEKLDNGAEFVKAASPATAPLATIGAAELWRDLWAEIASDRPFGRQGAATAEGGPTGGAMSAPRFLSLRRLPGAESFISVVQ